MDQKESENYAIHSIIDTFFYLIDMIENTHIESRRISYIGIKKAHIRMDHVLYIITLYLFLHMRK